RAEDGIAVVGTAAPVQAVALDHRLPGPEVLGPAGHFRLLVQVAIQQHAVLAAVGAVAEGGDLEVDQRGASFQAYHFHGHAGDGRGPGPGLHQFHGVVHVAVLDPLGVEHGRLVRDADVLHQLRDDAVVPDCADEAVDPAAIHRALPACKDFRF